MDFDDLRRLVAGGESETVEFKKSTAQLPRAGETLCGFLNGLGGQVLMGVSPNGDIVGQTVTDKTQQDVARVLARFEPAPPVDTQILSIPGSEPGCDGASGTAGSRCPPLHL